MVILDTSIIIDHLRQTLEKKTYLTAVLEIYPSSSLALSVITIQELYRGQSTRHSDRENGMLQLLQPFQVLPYTYEIAKKAGHCMRDAAQPLELADAAIAATALLHAYPILTLNVKDFQLIPDLELLPLFQLQ